MGRARTWKGAGVAAIGAFAALSASAQTAAPPAAPAKVGAGLPGADSKQPVDVTAEHGELFNDERRAVYSGNVEAIQGQDRLRTPVLTVFFAKKDPNAPAEKGPAPAAGAPAGSTFGKIERMEAEGTVYFTTPTQNAKGDHGTFLAAPDTITLTGNVVLVQDKNVSTGDKLVIDRKTDHSTLYSNTGASGSQRVRGVFYQDQAPAAGGAPTGKPVKSGPAHS